MASPAKYQVPGTELCETLISAESRKLAKGSCFPSQWSIYQRPTTHHMSADERARKSGDREMEEAWTLSAGNSLEVKYRSTSHS